MTIILQFDEPIPAADGHRYRARVCGAEDEIKHWQGWLEFEDAEDRTRVLRTERETTQPNRRDLEYWATGLSMVYLEGALERALSAGAEGGEERA